MAVDYRFKKGIDMPSWHWLSPFPTAPGSSPGAGNAYDGVRYIYWGIQYGSTASASTSQLWRYDTWTNGWQYLTTLTSAFTGLDVEYDASRNLVYVIIGGTTGFQVFNLNATSVTVFNQAVAAWTTATIAIVLPNTAGAGASMTMPDDKGMPVVIDSGAAAAGSTTTTLNDNKTVGTFAAGMTGLQVRMTSGAQSGQRRIVTGAPTPTSLTFPALPGAPAVGDTFVVELPASTAAAGGTTATLPTGLAMTANLYANSDVVITAGTGSGQRRRIGSNDAAGVLTLAAAVTGTPRTGPFTTAPDATSVFQIVPSNDFLYYQPGGASGALHRIDVNQTTGTAWTALTATALTVNGGGNTFHPSGYAPFQILCIRGNATASLQVFNIGLNTWTTLTTFAGSETFTTGASACLIKGKRKVFIQKESSGRCYTFDLTTGMIDGAGYLPYAAPAAYDGHRARHVQTADGLDWVYLLRAGGQEFYRVPVEWL